MLTKDTKCLTVGETIQESSPRFRPIYGFRRKLILMGLKKLFDVFRGDRLKPLSRGRTLFPPLQGFFEAYEDKRCSESSACLNGFAWISSWREDDYASGASVGWKLCKGNQRDECVFAD